jgi:hypothetical protein
MQFCILEVKCYELNNQKFFELKLPKLFMDYVIFIVVAHVVL